MALEFNNVASLFKQVRSDLLDKTYPHLFMGLTTSTKVKLRDRLAEAAKKHGGKPPQLSTLISKVPIPGYAEVSTVFIAADEPTNNQKSHAEANAYKDVFASFNENNLGSKAAVLNLLLSVGIK